MELERTPEIQKRGFRRLKGKPSLVGTQLCLIEMILNHFQG
jgi:hypothetical protein